MSEPFRSLAGRKPDAPSRDTDTRSPQDPMHTGLTLTIVGVVLFVVAVIVVVARTLYSTVP